VSRPVVCFDIGGVLTRIAHTWTAACSFAGLAGLEVKKNKLDDFEGLIRYQAGELGASDYLTALEEWLGAPAGTGESIHQAILLPDYEGALELVRDLQNAGIWTCCFSNTNELHWTVLTNTTLHPAVARLDARFASHIEKSAKPDLGAFRTTRSHFPDPEARVIFFDDTLSNVYGSRAADWEPFRIDPKNDPPSRMRAILERLRIL
jgi:FMN phosphatase YigB (HAD superfamily)